MALRAARKAGQIIVRALDRVDRVNAEQKGKNDWVSDIDRAAEAAIMETLLTAYPDHGFLGEESGIARDMTGTPPGLSTRWTAPPTSSEAFPISRSPSPAGGTDVSNMRWFDPLRDEARGLRGYGAQLNGKRLRVTRLPSLDGAIIGTGIPYRQKAAHLQPYLGMAGAVTQEAADLRRAGSAALDLAYVAAGRFDGYGSWA